MHPLHVVYRLSPPLATSNLFNALELPVFFDVFDVAGDVFKNVFPVFVLLAIRSFYVPALLVIGLFARLLLLVVDGWFVPAVHLRLCLLHRRYVL